MAGGRMMKFEDGPGRPERRPDQPAAGARGGSTGDGAADGPQLAARLEELRVRLGECDWRDPDLLARAATLSQELGLHTEAVSMLERALRLDPEHAYARAKIREIATPEELSRTDVPPEVVRLSRNFWEPFAYPLRGSGPWMIGVGGVFYALVFAGLGMIISMLLVAPIGLAVGAILVGYLLEFFRKVTITSASGKSESPDWPDFDPGLFVLPLGFAVLVLAAHLPAVIGAVVLALAGRGGLNPLVAGLLLLALVETGGLVMPMMALIYFMRRSVLEALNPVLVFRSIAACGREYWLAVLVWLLIPPARALAGLALGGVPLLGPILGTAATIYFGMVSFRALGLIYRSNQARLSW